MKNGTWINNPDEIKSTFFQFFEEKFGHFECLRIHRRSDHYKSLNTDQMTFLDAMVTEEEVHDVIWDCGSDKSSGPDGFTFSFFKKFWDTLKDGIISFVKEFFVSGLIPNGCNSSFITLIPKVNNPSVVTDYRPISLIGAQYKIIAKILANRLAQVIGSIISCEQSAFLKSRQILDGPLMVNEIVDWFKRKKRTLMIFKVDFEKAFDSVSWDFLYKVMSFTGFSQKWISWIRGCLSSARTSIIVNGSPTKEFSLKRGLRQGDPISPFLFLLIMEGLHVAVNDATSTRIFRGAKVGSLQISHIFFAYDVIFLGEWSRKNVTAIVHILQCFYRVSGLRLNLRKSNLYGIGVEFSEVQRLALLNGCNPNTIPFVYLGMPKADSISKKKGWDTVVKRFDVRLSKWKASFSIGGRSTLLTSVLGALGTYFFLLFPMPKCINNLFESIRAHFLGKDGSNAKFPWVAWMVVMAVKKHGGLGFGSLISLNHALIQKRR
ncbi:RNA-directed DNA polymerase, eukaryota, reverse transcriptase zinc-binding domain protein [Tanacetum coccineum]